MLFTAILLYETVGFMLTRQANQLRNEESVEAIIRKRSLDGKPEARSLDIAHIAESSAFKSRCPYFTPPVPDTAGRGWWDLADSGRIGKGPELP